jgi:hypothetical protein
VITPYVSVTEFVVGIILIVFGTGGGWCVGWWLAALATKNREARMFNADRGTPGSCQDNPLNIDSEIPDLANLPWNNRNAIWVRTPSGQLAKCYFSYADYCDD